MGDYSIVVIDDERTARGTELPIEYLRTSSEALEFLREVQASGERINELWLDHDLGEDSSPHGWDTIIPVVNWLEEQAFYESPLQVDVIFIHTQNESAVPVMIDALRPWYTVVRTKFPV